MVAIGNGVADLDILYACQPNDVARAGGLKLDPLQSLPAVELGDFHRLLEAVGAAEGVQSHGQRAVLQPSYRQAADIIAVIEVVDLKLCRNRLVDQRPGKHPYDHVKQRKQVLRRLL